jgi:ATP-dependent Clp protease ATP-binding subunit ClpB
VEHLLLAFAQDKQFGQQLFKDFHISLKNLTSAIQAICGSQKVIDQGMVP